MPKSPNCKKSLSDTQFTAKQKKHIRQKIRYTLYEIKSDLMETMEITTICAKNVLHRLCQIVLQG